MESASQRATWRSSRGQRSFLDLERIAAIDQRAFRARTPFPWLGEPGLLREEAWEELMSSMPDPALLQPQFGLTRKFGQRSHDRYVLEHSDALDLPRAWVRFIQELRGREYRSFLTRMLGTRMLSIRFHWHYTPAGCSVSPHCDGRRELGTHLFYFNRADEWDSSWGGATLILDDGAEMALESAPDFDDFVSETPCDPIGNRSLLFARTEHSWHGMRELRCPPGKLRKVFGVVVNRNDPIARVKHFLGRA